MQITAKIIADSISPEGVRLTTMHCRYPRMIHSEVMTHRVFSRNGRSSRAVPVATLLQEEAYLPHFMQNKPGMVATEELHPFVLNECNEIWLDLVDYTKKAVAKLNSRKVHKQHANRPLEWFGWIDVLISSTDWANWFELRDEVGAQPEIDQLAKAMKIAMDESTPAKCLPGSWHLPYIDLGIDGPAARDWLYNGNDPDVIVPCVEPSGEEIYEVLKKISVARCARLTIKPFDGDGSIEKELKRYDLLMVSRPVHASPAEHIATPDTFKISKSLGDSVNQTFAENPSQWGNFYGWRQFRKMIPHNTIQDR